MRAYASGIPLKIAFDVDGTLFNYDDKPNEGIIKLLKKLADYHEIYVWSGGGKGYAEQRVRELGLEEYVVSCHSKLEGLKVDICFDDQASKLASIDVQIVGR